MKIKGGVANQKFINSRNFECIVEKRWQTIYNLSFFPCALHFLESFFETMPVGLKRSIHLDICLKRSDQVRGRARFFLHLNGRKTEGYLLQLL